MSYRNALIKLPLVALFLLLATTVQAGSWVNGTVHTSVGARNYKLWRPARYTGKTALPLVMMLHGCTQTPDDFATGTGMNSVAEQHNFLVVYPEQPADANPLKCWNWFDPAQQVRGQGEPALLAEIINEVRARYRVDARRVFVAGSSAGGAMAVIMGATYPDLFAAVGVHSGLAYKAATNLLEARTVMAQGGADPARLGQLAAKSMGDAKHLMRVIVFQGANDGAVAPVNADQIITQWAQTNDYLDDGQDNDSVDDMADKTTEGTVSGGYAYKQYIYNDRAGRPLMGKWIIQGLKHAWSGGAGGAYTDPKGPNASQELWRFFLATRPPMRMSSARRGHGRE
jgi:poly(hydroxyalkanoate) depolymerase family esterase